MRRRPIAAPRVFGLLALLATGSALAGEMGHYVAGSWSPRDLIAAPPGMVAFAAYGAVYTADRARTGSGEVIDGSDGLYVNADSWMFTPVLVFAPEYQLLGANWSVTLVPAYGEAGANARLSGFGESLTLFDNNRRGLGDTYLVPATLTWALSPELSLSAQYAVWVPTGSYEPDRADNIGVGYWSQDFRGTISWFPLGNPGILVSASVVHEINGEKEGFDLRPAPHTSLELGYSMATSERFMFGLLLNGLWETGSASGNDAQEDGRDRLYSAGAEATYWFIPGQVGGTIRYTNEFGARDRFEGSTSIAGINVIF